MEENLLIIKKRGQNIKMKITPKVRAGFVPDHKLVVNLKNYKNVAMMFHDMKALYNVPIDKAIEEYKNGKSQVWPF